MNEKEPSDVPLEGRDLMVYNLGRLVARYYQKGKGQISDMEVKEMTNRVWGALKERLGIGSDNNG